MTTFAEVEAKIQRWDWQNFIPSGTLTVLAGDRGISKGRLLAWAAAQYTNGAAWPTTGAAPRGGVILASPEDDAETELVWRLSAAQADLGAVTDLSYPHPERPADPIQIPQDLGLLRDKIIETGARLVILDPLGEIAGCSIGQEPTVRAKIMRPLGAMARELDVAIVLVIHLTKDGRRVAGSAAIVNRARHVLMVTWPQGARRRVIEVYKSNMIDKSAVAPLSYELTGDYPATRIVFASAETRGTLLASHRFASPSASSAAASPRHAFGVPARLREMA